MTRTNAREIALHLLFELAFSQHNANSILEERLSKEHFQGMKLESMLYSQYPNKKQADYIRQLVEGAFLHSPELDEYISRYAKGWSFARIPKVISALMRIAMFEMIYMPEIPDSVTINDALEIGKHYDDPEVISFMNGILGNFLRTELEGSSLRKTSFQEEVFDKIDARGEKEDGSEGSEGSEDTSEQEEPLEKSENPAP